MKVNDGAGLESLAIDGKKGGLKDGGGGGGETLDIEIK